MRVNLLDPETELLLERLAKLTGRTPAECAREAIREHLEELEEIALATKRLASPGPTSSAEEVKRELGL